MPPFNTAIVKGFNAVTGSKVKLGRWDQYLAMRAGMLQLNNAYRDLLSNDLGAIAGFLFDVGSERYLAPPVASDDNAREVWLKLSQARETAKRLQGPIARDREGDRTHTEIQAWLKELGHALGYRVWIAANDRGRIHDGGTLGAGCLEVLPASIENAPGADTVRLIDVLWIEANGDRVVAAFEVEHTTSIYSGIVRMLDLALGSDLHARDGLFLVAPDARQEEVRAQLHRPAFHRIADLQVRFLPYGELEKHKEAIARFGSGMKGIEAISRVL